jgi:hypothetical protein
MWLKILVAIIAAFNAVIWHILQRLSAVKLQNIRLAGAVLQEQGATLSTGD